MKKYFLLFCFLLLAELLHGQPYYFRHYQVENGLSNNTVYCSTQDRNGFMWFGTKDGLNRFDGYTFKTYRHDLARPHSIGNDHIYAIQRNKGNGLWIGTANGLFSYDPARDAFQMISQTSGMIINYLVTDQQDNVWFISSGSIYLINTHNHTLYKIRTKPAFVAALIYCRANGEIWIAGATGTIERYDKRTGRFTPVQVRPGATAVPLGWIAALAETDEGKILIGTVSEGIKLLDPDTHVMTTLIKTNEDKTHIFVRDIKKFNAHTFWIATESGIYIYNSEQKNITHLKKLNGNPYTLSDNAVYSLYKDKEGGMWTGTYFGGLNYYTKKYAVFTKYFPMQQNNTISGNAVSEICKDQYGNLWIGTEDAGLNQLNLKTGLFSIFRPDGSHHSISYTNIHGLLAVGNKLWIGTFEHGLDIMDMRTGKILKHYSYGKKSGLQSNFIFTFCRTRSGKILVATTMGVYQYNAARDNFECIPGMPLQFYNSLLEDEEGTIWAGTFDDGVYCFRLDIRGYRHFKTSDRQENSIGSNTINSIFQDSRKQIWITTDGGGFCRYNKKDANFSRYNTGNGFPSNFIFEMQEDKRHRFWISSTSGLIRFDPSTGKIKAYSKSEGLLSEQFNYNSSFKDSDGRMYFGSVKGLISFDPEQLNDTSLTVPVFITGFHFDNEGSKIRPAELSSGASIAYTDTLTLSYQQSSFSIDFAALSYFSPEMTEYTYKMNGLYQNWEYLKTNRKVYFTKLAPGNYLFEARALIKGSTVWSKKNARLFIRVLPPVWKSTPAFFFYILLISGGVFYIVYHYHKKLERKNSRRMEIFEHEKEKEIYQAKIEFFTNIAHEIRTPLTLIKGPMEKLIKQVAEVPAIEKNLRIMDKNTDRLINLTNQLLDFRKAEINHFSLNFVKADIAVRLADIILNFQTAAEQKKIIFNLQGPVKEISAYIDIEAFNKIISNLIDNALKYGKSKIWIELQFSDQTETRFQIRVMNDGNLIPIHLFEKIFIPFYRLKENQIKPGTGLGMSISRSLAELHNGTLTMQNHTERNVFVLDLPVHQLIEFNLNGKWKKL